MTANAVLYVKDLDRMRAFYAGCFDLETVEEEADYAIAGSPTWELALVLAPAGMAEQVYIAAPPLRREQTAVKLGFEVASIDAARLTLQRLGGVVDRPATEWEFRGMRRCDAIDPEGNVIQLLMPSSEVQTTRADR